VRFLQNYNRSVLTNTATLLEEQICAALVFQCDRGCHTLLEGVIDAYYYGYNDNFCSYNNLTFTDEFHLKYNSTVAQENITTSDTWMDEGWFKFFI